MKPALLIITLAGLAILVVVFATGDTRISESPVEVAEIRATKSIEAAGADPADWQMDAECVAQGPCFLDVSAKDLPGVVIATDQYVVKDTRATVNGPANIEDAARRAVERNCFEGSLGESALEACLTRN